MEIIGSLMKDILYDKDKKTATLDELKGITTITSSTPYGEGKGRNKISFTKAFTKKEAEVSSINLMKKMEK